VNSTAMSHSISKRNAVFGLMSFLLPSILLFLSYPLMLNGLGDDGFGIYMLAMGVPSLVSIVDMGLFATTTRFIAEDISNENLDDASEVWSSSILFYFLLSLIGAATIYLLAPWVTSVMNVSSSLREGSIGAFRLAALMLPFILVTNAFIAAFKGFSRFDFVMVALIAQAFLLYLLPALGVFFYGINIIEAMRVTLISSSILFMLLVYLSLVIRRRTGVFWFCIFSPMVIYRRMFTYGVMITLSGVMGAAVAQLSRYLVGWLFGPAAAGQYSLVYTLSSKIQALVNSATEFIFPLASTISDLNKIKSIYTQMRLGGGVLAFICLVPLVFFADDILSLWLRRTVDGSVGTLLSLFCIAAFFSSMITMPHHLLNGFGYPLWNVVLLFSHLIVLCISVFVLLSIFQLGLMSFGYAFILSNFYLAVVYQVASLKVFSLNVRGTN